MSKLTCIQCGSNDTKKYQHNKIKRMSCNKCKCDWNYDDISNYRFRISGDVRISTYFNGDNGGVWVLYLTDGKLDLNNDSWMISDHKITIKDAIAKYNKLKWFI